METQSYSQNPVASSSLAQFYTAVYGWMVIGMLVTAFMSYVTLSTAWGMGILIDYGSILPWVYLAFMIGIQFIAHRIPAEVSRGVFLILAALNGMLLSGLAYAYSGASLVTAFVVTAGLFAGLALYGQRTGKDLSSWGTVIMMGIWGALAAGLINYFFLQNSVFSTILSAVVILVFSASIAYNNQQYKAIHNAYQGDEEGLKRASTLGAIQMYISFSAIFTSLLNLFGSSD